MLSLAPRFILGDQWSTGVLELVHVELHSNPYINPFYSTPALEFGVKWNSTPSTVNSATLFA